MGYFNTPSHVQAILGKTHGIDECRATSAKYNWMESGFDTC